ncbi:DMT family transporter [Gracilibacillus marinus]|uniref:DMT family transporter n=1 Tax=Gracilibacillus marinus TaxID=630535 RepID=A0ABV8VXM3_9BACI
MNRNWIYVILAGIVEILWAMGLKYSTNWISWFGTIALIAFSFYLLIEATKKLPVATVYAIFTGIGTAGTAVVEIIIFNEPFHLVKIGFILLLLVGVIGLKLVTNERVDKEGAN